MFTKEYWKSSAEKLKSIHYIALMAAFIAMKIIVGNIYIPVAQNLRIGINFVLVAVEASILGPVAGMVSAAVTDLLGFALFPSGPFFAGYTLTAVCGSFIYAMLFYRKRITVLRITIAKVLNNYLVNVLLGSLWSAILYDKAFIVYAATSAMVPIVGALFGERDWWSMHQVAMRITKMVMGFVLVSIFLIELLPGILLAFFGVHDAAIMEMGVPALRIYALGFLLSSLSYILMTYMQTTARKLFSIAISVGTELLAILFIYLLGYSLGNIGVWSHTIAAQAVLLFLSVLTAKYIGKKSNGKYHGVFIHEVQPDYVMGNSIYATQEEAVGYTDMIGEFFAAKQVSPQAVAEAKHLLNQVLRDIVEKEKNPQKTIDIMAVLHEGYIKIRLRDDSGVEESLQLESDERIGRLSVMGYNNTYIKIPV